MTERFVMWYEDTKKQSSLPIKRLGCDWSPQSSKLRRSGEPHLSRLLNLLTLLHLGAFCNQKDGWELNPGRFEGGLPSSLFRGE